MDTHMMRIVGAFTAMAIVIAGLLVVSSSPARPAHACSIPPSDFERDTQSAAFVALVDAVEVGVATNALPPLPTTTASPTYAPPATDTPAAAATRTPRGAKTATSTETAVPTWTPVTMPTPESLAGIGATLEIVTLYAGEASSPIVIDMRGRTAYEYYLRQQEALIPNTNSCAGGRPVSYTRGARYVVYGHAVDGGFATDIRIPVEGDDAVFGTRGLAMTEAAYHRYFEGLPAEIEDGYARVTVDRMPLATLARAIRVARRGTIVPPETGSAGLASRRR